MPFISSPNLVSFTFLIAYTNAKELKSKQKEIEEKASSQAQQARAASGPWKQSQVQCHTNAPHFHFLCGFVPSYYM